MKRMIARMLSALLAVLLLWGPAPVAAQQAEGEKKTATQLTKEAREKFRELSASAQKKFQDGDYDGAIADFEAAYAIKPSSNILYNIGRIHEQQGNIDEAISYYDRFVVAPNVEIKARQDAVNRLRTLKEVRDLRDQEAKKAQADAGADGDGSTQAGAPAPVAQPAPDRTAAWVFLGIGATTLIGAGVFGVLTSMQHEEYESAQTLQARRDAANTGQTFGYLADGLLATGVLTGAIGAILWVLATPDESGVAVTGGVTGDGATVGLSWSFQ
jgi:tetratricopeptide (TPR) repeat protein